MQKGKRKTGYSRKERACDHDCDTCANAIYICEGDTLCDQLHELVKEDHVPSDHWYACGGKYYEKG